jgi:2-polyprenyl-3-methyl-5-hydroxy-6-metoxy-1,4-benzoquinol methylase
MAISERFTWAAELMAIKSDDRVLEIGCGAGLLAECIAEQLTTGRVLGIDQSSAMIASAVKRNRKHIERGVSDFECKRFADCKLPDNSFDTVAAFNVNLFTKDSPHEMMLISQMIKHNGRLYVFYQAPVQITITAAKPMQKLLVKNGFETIDVKFKKLKPTSAVCVVARKKAGT